MVCAEKKERARTNNGAKRKQHLEVEVVEEVIEPEDPRFNKGHVQAAVPGTQAAPDRL